MLVCRRALRDKLIKIGANVVTTAATSPSSWRRSRYRMSNSPQILPVFLGFRTLQDLRRFNASAWARDCTASMRAKHR